MTFLIKNAILKAIRNEMTGSYKLWPDEYIVEDFVSENYEREMLDVLESVCYQMDYILRFADFIQFDSNLKVSFRKPTDKDISKLSMECDKIDKYICRVYYHSMENKTADFYAVLLNALFRLERVCGWIELKIGLLWSLDLLSGFHINFDHEDDKLIRYHGNIDDMNLIDRNAIGIKLDFYSKAVTKRLDIISIVGDRKKGIRVRDVEIRDENFDSLPDSLD